MLDGGLVGVLQGYRVITLIGTGFRGYTQELAKRAKQGSYFTFPLRFTHLTGSRFYKIMSQTSLTPADMNVLFGMSRTFRSRAFNSRTLRRSWPMPNFSQVALTS